MKVGIYGIVSISGESCAIYVYIDTCIRAHVYIYTSMFIFVQGVEAGSLKHTRAEANSRPEDRATLKKTAAQSGKWEQSYLNQAPIKVER